MDFGTEEPEEVEAKFAEAWKEWYEATKYRKRKGKSFEYTEHQQRDIELRATNPYYKKVTDEIRDRQPPFSYVQNMFIPSMRQHVDEAARVESTIGRYPVGFRHYENYYNYLTKYPDATIEDYQNDSKFNFCIFIDIVYFCSQLTGVLRRVLGDQEGGLDVQDEVRRFGDLQVEAAPAGA